MISFRFHVVSITAVFLAIAIGIVVGSTYIEGATVDQLENRIDTVEDRAAATREENDRLKDELDTTGQYVELSSEFAVSGRLTDVPTLVVAVRGVDEAAVERTVALARRAGGRVPGIVWIEPQWVLEGDDREAFATIVGGSATDDPEVLWASAWEQITDDLASEPPSELGPEGSDLDIPSGAGPSTLEELEAVGFVTVDSLDDDSVGLADLVGAGPRVLVVTGTRAAEEIAPLVPVAVDASVAAELVTVVADIYVVASEAPGRGAALADALDETVRESIVIVDNADLEPGRVAAVLALDSAADGEVGRHYGYGDGADAVLPAWTPP